MEDEIVSFIFPDSKLIESIRYEFPAHLILLEEVTLAGFEIYLVEQWVSERKRSTLITTYTGSLEDQISAIRLTILSVDETVWPVHLRSYITELVDSQHCKPKETESGIIYITNLSQFPSILNLIEVEKGNVNQVWEIFNVNLNLKKMGCSGRSVLTLTQPTKSMEDKFRQTFKIHPAVDVNFAARELVLIIQTFLYYYNLFPANLCDGILCDITESAIQKWWDTIGTAYYEVKHKQWEGLSPVTVCAIVSFTMNIKLRLELLNTSSIDVPKDPLNVERFRLSIGQFQKYSLKYSSAPQAPVPPQQPSSLALPGGLQFSEEYSFFLDEITIDNLMAFSNHKMSSQQFKNDFNKVKKMLKNTVSDISSGRTYLNLSSSNAALAMTDTSTMSYHNLETFNDLLTLDISKMINFVQGKRLVYIWRGKGKQVAIEHVSLARSIRDQLAKLQRDLERSNHHASASHSTTDYLSLPTTTVTNSSAGKSSDDKRSYRKTSVNGSGNGLEIYDTEESYDNGTTDDGYSARFDKDSENGSRKPSTVGYDQWLFLDNDKNFECQLSRRSSFPSIDKELNNSLLTHTQDFLWNDDPLGIRDSSDSYPRRLKRSNSFSLIESSILLWDYPFSPSVNRIASEYLSLRQGLELHIRDSSENLSLYIKELETQIDSEEPITYNPFGPGSRKHNRLLDSKAIDELYNKVNSKGDFLEVKLKDIDLLNSRLTYELRLLNNKVKDVEDNLRQLQDFKLKKVIENLTLYEAQRSDLKDVISKYQKLQHRLNGTSDSTAGLRRQRSIISSEKADTVLLVITVYLLSVWHEILKMFSSEHKMDNVVSSGGLGLEDPAKDEDN